MKCFDFSPSLCLKYSLLPFFLQERNFSSVKLSKTFLVENYFFPLKISFSMKTIPEKKVFS